MEDDAGSDAMAHSQLALLYKLGLLEQGAGEENEDAHAFLNQLPPPSAPENVPISFTGHSRLSPRGFQSSGDRAREDIMATGASAHSAHSPYAPIRPYTPLTKPRTPWPDPVDREERIRVPLSPLAASTAARRGPSFLGQSNDQVRTHALNCNDVLVKQIWFAVWRQRVEQKRTRARVAVVGRRSIKRRIWTRWLLAVYQRRIQHTRGQVLLRWKSQRVIRVWKSWATLRSRVTFLLTSKEHGHHTFMARWRRQRSWQRWRVYAKQNQRYHNALCTAASWRDRRCLRRLWLEWRVLVFHARRRQAMYRQFLDAVRHHQRLRHERWVRASDSYDQCVCKHLQRRFHRWWMFTVQRNRDHQRTYQIRMVMNRATFFQLWHSTFMHTQQIAVLRGKVAQRIKREHTRAWHLVTRACQLSRSSTLWHSDAIRARYLRMWSRAAHDSAHFRLATAQVHTNQKRRVVRQMRAWALSHHHAAELRARAEAIASRRRLLHVWVDGLLAFHFKRQQEKRLTNQVKAITEGKAFGSWRRMAGVRHAWRCKKHTARRMAQKASLALVWKGWWRHVLWRRHHKATLVAAANHHQHHQMITGLLALSKAVDRTISHTKAARQIRISQRKALKCHVLHGLHRHIQKKKALTQRLHRFVSRSMYSQSLWNPLRRRWDQWVAFVQAKNKQKLIHHQRQSTCKQRVFRGWKIHTQIAGRLRVFRQSCHQRVVRFVFTRWKQQAIEWTARQERLILASQLDRKRHCRAALYAWNQLVCGRLRRLRHVHSIVDATHQQRQCLHWFREWRIHFTKRRGVLTLATRRRHAWLQFCWDGWHQYYLMATRWKRKAKYFRQVYGEYPSTSFVSRVLKRWRKYTQQQVTVKKLRRQYELGIVGACTGAWKSYHLAKKVLHEWHTLSVVTAATNNDLGSRRRLFRQRQELRVIGRVFSLWVQLVRDCHVQFEKLAIERRRVPHDLRCAVLVREKRRRHHLRLWFLRWRRRQLLSLHHACCVHRQRVLRRVVHGWWRQVIHLKQERVLEQARHTMGLLSIHKHKENMASRRPQAKASTQRRTTPAKPATGGRMVDPRSHGHSYAHSNQTMVAAAQLRVNQQRRLVEVPNDQVEAKQMQPRMVEPAPTQRSKMGQEGTCTNPRESIGRMVEDPRGVAVHRLGHPPVEELPLFDSDSVLGEEPLSSRQEATIMPPIQQPKSVYFSPQESPNKQNDAIDSLEAIAAMDLYSLASLPIHDQQAPQLAYSSWYDVPPPPPSLPPSHHHVATNNRQSAHHKIPSASEYTPDQSLLERPISKPPPSRIPPVKRAAVVAETQDLAQLLEIPLPARDATAATTFREVLHSMKTTGTTRDDHHLLNDDQPLDIQLVIQKITTYYVVKSSYHQEEEVKVASGGGPRAWLQTYGFCMLRDLGLFENRHFVSAMERAIDGSSLLSISSDGHLSDDHKEELLRSLLKRFVAVHPAGSSSSSREENPFTWLVSAHLLRRHGRAALTTTAGTDSATTSRPFWIRHELPVEIVGSLVKLLACIKKYQKQISTFFRWRPPTASARGSAFSENSMDSPAFIQLMKHCQVHPQLFDRRELEHSVECAGTRYRSNSRREAATSGNEVRLHMPGFVEALMRCSLRLQWAENNAATTSGSPTLPHQQQPSRSVVGVVKFVMLIFAMEGKGSMLTTRRQDLDIVLELLQRTEDHKKSVKLTKFQTLLRTEATGQRKGGSHAKRTSTFRSAVGRDHFFDGRHEHQQKAMDHSYGHGGHDEVEHVQRVRQMGIDVRSDGDLHLHGQSRGHDHHRERESLPHFVSSHPQRARSEMIHPRSSGVTIPTDSDPTLSGRPVDAANATDHRAMGELLDRRVDLGREQPRYDGESGDLLDSPLAGGSTDLPVVGGRTSSGIREDATVSQASGAQSATWTSFSPRLDDRPTNDRQAFLDEILSSIHDVELLLRHSDAHKSTLSQPTTGETVEFTSEPFSVAYPERYEVLMTGQLPSSCSTAANDVMMVADSIHVGDPMLDYLTFADRFSESRDWQAALSIANVAEHGIHGAFPSSRHVTDRLQTDELDDLTDAQQAVAYLRHESSSDDAPDML